MQEVTGMRRILRAATAAILSFSLIILQTGYIALADEATETGQLTDAGDTVLVSDALTDEGVADPALTDRTAVNAGAGDGDDTGGDDTGSLKGTEGTPEKPQDDDSPEDAAGQPAEKNADAGSSSDSGETVSGDAVSVDPDAISAIDKPEVTELTLEYKLALESLLEELPETVTIHFGDESRKIEADWICDGNYDEELGDYVFRPSLDGYKLARDLVIPSVTVRFENEGAGNVSGYINDPLAYDVPMMKRRMRKSSGLPSSYNGYEQDRLPMIRDQGSHGTCWSFSSMGSVEADLIHDGADTEENLSEMHLVYYTSHEYTDPKTGRADSARYVQSSNYETWMDNGGNGELSYRTLSNAVGAVQEGDASYSDGPSYSPRDLDADASGLDYARISNVYVISVSDKDSIKRAILDHGGVDACYYETQSVSEYSATYNSYNSKGKTYPNHAVMLVGWDDDFPKSRFNVTPEGNGAWLVRNSWGLDGYGHRGYFWISYYDSGFNASDYVIAYDATTDVYDNCYAYDGQPIFDRIYHVSPTDTVTQTFDVKAGETLKAVGFEIASSDVTAEITVKDKETGQTATTTVGTTYAGFYTAEFSGLDFIFDTEVEVSINYTSGDGSDVAILAEAPVELYYGNIVWKGVNDKGFKIKDSYMSCDARMKLYTDYCDISGTENIKLDGTAFSGHWKETAQIALAEDSVIQDISKIKWTSTNSKIADVDENGLITFGAYKGTARIKGEHTTSGGGTETVWISATVLPYKVTYHLEDYTDIIHGTLTSEFYPGDPVNSHLSDQVWRSSGYALASWYKDKALKRPVSFYPDECADLELYPGWHEFSLSISYYIPNSWLNGYLYATKPLKTVRSSQLPYTLPSAAGADYNPNDFTSYYNSNYAPKAFSYWSWDPAGKNKVTQVTAVQYGIKYNASTGHVTCDGFSATVYPQFKETGQTVPVTQVKLNKTAMSLTAGQTGTLSATVLPVNATNKKVTWKSGNTGIATVNASGVVKGVRPGTVTITATSASGGKTASCKVTVKPIPVTGVRLNKTSANIYAGYTTTLSATVLPTNATNKGVTWSSSNNKVASVTSQGVVRGIKKGTATITVTTSDGKKKATCKITVKAPIVVKKVKINRSSAKLKVGQSVKLSASVSPSNAVDKRITWYSSDPRIATVSSSGTVKAVRKGTAYIYARSANGKKTKCTIKVK